MQRLHVRIAFVWPDTAWNWPGEELEMTVTEVIRHLVRHQLDHRKNDVEFDSGAHAIGCGKLVATERSRKDRSSGLSQVNVVQIEREIRKILPVETQELTRRDEQ